MHVFNHHFSANVQLEKVALQEIANANHVPELVDIDVGTAVAEVHVEEDQVERLCVALFHFEFVTVLTAHIA